MLVVEKGWSKWLGGVFFSFVFICLVWWWLINGLGWTGLDWGREKGEADGRGDNASVAFSSKGAVCFFTTTDCLRGDGPRG